MQDQARYPQGGLSELEVMLNSMARRMAEDMMPRVQSELPPGTPLVLSISRASDVFDISERQLRRLIKVPGFPVMKVGGSVKIPTYKAVKWFEANVGEVIELE